MMRPAAVEGSIKGGPVKIVVIGGTGLIGSKVVTNLSKSGFETVPASRRSGVDTISGRGLAAVLAKTSVVIDLSNPPTYDGAQALAFFETSARNLRSAEEAAGVQHHVTLSVVGTDRLSESGYMHAKFVQEKLIEDSSIPHSIVHATLFFESIHRLAGLATDGSRVRIPPGSVQPTAGDASTRMISSVTLCPPLNGRSWLPAPDRFPLVDRVRRRLIPLPDPR